MSSFQIHLKIAHSAVLPSSRSNAAALMQAYRIPRMKR